MTALQQFQDVCDIADKNFLNLFDTRILESKNKIKMHQDELNHWEQMKKVFLESKSTSLKYLKPSEQNPL